MRLLTLPLVLMLAGCGGTVGGDDVPPKPTCDYDEVLELMAGPDACPYAVREDGVRSRDVPHVDIVNLGRWLNGVRSDGVWSINACTGYVDGHDVHLPIGRTETLDEALALIPAAVGRARGARAEVAAAYAEISKARGDALSRSQYESLCAEFGFEPKAEAVLAMHLGDPRFPEVPVSSVQAFLLALRRQRALRREAESEASRAAATVAQDHEATVAQLKAAPIVETYEMLVPAEAGHVPGCVIIKDGRVHTVTKSRRAGVITADDPSVHGEHLLGHEGTPGCWIAVEVRA